MKLRMILDDSDRASWQASFLIRVKVVRTLRAQFVF